MIRPNFFTLLFVSSIILIGCSNSAFEKEEQRVKKIKDETLMADDETKKEKKQDNVYKELEKPLEEVILENDLDPRSEVESTQVAKKEHYEDANEFAKYAAGILYEFYTITISPEEYYEFLMNYGSKEVIKELPTKNDAIVILTTLQDMFKKQNITGETYTLTNVELDRFKRNGTFYRKVLTTNGEEYFITSITKENKGWKYVEDSPSPPYTELTNKEEKQKSTIENTNKGDSDKNANTGS